MLIYFKISFGTAVEIYGIQSIKFELKIDFYLEEYRILMEGLIYFLTFLFINLNYKNLMFYK